MIKVSIFITKENDPDKYPDQHQRLQLTIKTPSERHSAGRA